MGLFGHVFLASVFLPPRLILTFAGSQPGRILGLDLLCPVPRSHEFTAPEILDNSALVPHQLRLFDGHRLPEVRPAWRISQTGGCSVAWPRQARRKVSLCKGAKRVMR